MRLIGRSKGIIQGTLVAMIAATALTGCGGSTSESGSSDSTSSTSGTATASSASSIALSSSNYSVVPGSSAIVTINRSGSAGAASASYNTIDGSAASGVDYTATQGTLTWADGDSSARTIIVPVRNSAQGKSFAIALMSIAGQASFGNPSSAVIQVTSSLASTSSSSGGSPSGSSSGTIASGSSSGTSVGSKTTMLSWSPPNENTNGSALTNLAGYNIYYGTSSGTMTNKISITTVGITNYVIQNMNSGNWYFAMTAVNSSGTESVLSGAIEATL
jgi:Calx-beta domain